MFQKIEAIFSGFGKFGPKFSKFLWFLSTSRSVIVVVVATGIFAAIGEPSPVLLVGKAIEIWLQEDSQGLISFH